MNILCVIGVLEILHSSVANTLLSLEGFARYKAKEKLAYDYGRHGPQSKGIADIFPKLPSFRTGRDQIWSVAAKHSEISTENQLTSPGNPLSKYREQKAFTGEKIERWLISPSFFSSIRYGRRRYAKEFFGRRKLGQPTRGFWNDREVQYVILGRQTKLKCLLWEKQDSHLFTWPRLSQKYFDGHMSVTAVDHAESLKNMFFSVFLYLVSSTVAL